MGLAEQLLGHVSLLHVSLSEIHSLHFLLSLLLSLLIESLPHHRLPLGETVLNDRLMKHVALHPRVRHDLLERGAVCWLELPHAVEQVLQLWRNEVGTLWLVLGVCSPEDVRAIVGNTFIEWIISLSTREWWMADHHDEQDNS